MASKVLQPRSYWPTPSRRGFIVRSAALGQPGRVRGPGYSYELQVPRALHKKSGSYT
jgi:hypothetical protein